MIEEKQSLTGKIESNQTLNGNINIGKEIIPPILQQKEVTPTKNVQEIVSDEDYNGLSKVIVNEIPSKYIEPTGEYEITKNGVYDITQYSSVNVATNEADVDWKSIGYNGTPKSIKNDYDYAVEIKNNWVPLADMTNKFNNNANLVIMPLVDTTLTTTANYMFSNCKNLKSVPRLEMPNITSMFNMFNGCNMLTDIDFSGFDIKNVNNFNYAFNNCYAIKELDLSTFENKFYISTSSMFYNCRALTKLDIRNMDLTKISSSSNMFGFSDSNGPADDCLIIVKDDEQKQWINSKFSRLTNVKTVAEYEQ